MTQGHKDTRTQGHKDTRTQGHKDTRTQGHKDTRTQGHKLCLFNKKIKERQKGFTLIELIVVIVILGILAATAMPKYLNMRRNARIAALQGMEGAVRSAISSSKAAYYLTNTYPDGSPIDKDTDVIEDFPFTLNDQAYQIAVTGARGLGEAGVPMASIARGDKDMHGIGYLLEGACHSPVKSTSTGAYLYTCDNGFTAATIFKNGFAPHNGIFFFPPGFTVPANFNPFYEDTIACALKYATVGLTGATALTNEPTDTFVAIRLLTESC